MTARADLRKQRNDRVEAERVLAQRKRYGKKMYENKREPRAVMKMRKREQQVSASKYRKVHDDRLDDARRRLETAETGCATTERSGSTFRKPRCRAAARS